MSQYTLTVKKVLENCSFIFIFVDKCKKTSQIIGQRQMSHFKIKVIILYLSYFLAIFMTRDVHPFTYTMIKLVQAQINHMVQINTSVVQEMSILHAMYTHQIQYTA
jgi:hypothetical protein